MMDWAQDMNGRSQGSLRGIEQILQLFEWTSAPKAIKAVPILLPDVNQADYQADCAVQSL